MRKVTLNLTVKVIVTMDEDLSVPDFISEIYYDVRDQTTKATIEDTEITGHEVIDSK